MEITPETIVQFRLLAGSDCLDMLDEDVTIFITAGGSVYRGLSLLYLRLAGDAAIKAKSVKDYDLQVSTEKRAEYLREISARWGDEADRQDEVAGTSDIFDSFGVPGNALPYYAPEAAPSRVTF